MPEVTIRDLIDLIGRSFEPERSEGFEATVQVNLSGEQGGKWSVRIADGKYSVVEGILDSPRLTLEASDQDILAIYDGRLDPVKAYMQGRLSLKGDRSLALKMLTFFNLKK